MAVFASPPQEANLIMTLHKTILAIAPLAMILSVLFSLPCRSQTLPPPSAGHQDNGVAVISGERQRTVGKSEFLFDHGAKLGRECHDKFNQIVEVAGYKILCLKGPIVAENNTENDKSRDFSIAYVNSGGGEISTAFRIGREIHDNAAYLMVDENCYSACANYLVPAARRLFMTDHTVIAMHGSLPRDSIAYAKIVSKAATEKAIASGSLNAIRKQIDENEKQFRVYVEDHLLDEFWYFIDIGRNEGYTRRFDHVRRRLHAVENSNCAPKQGLYLIVGPEHLKSYKIKTIRSWFPKDRAEYENLMPAPIEDHALIFDYDQFPFWHPQYGQTSHNSCQH